MVILRFMLVRELVWVVLVVWFIFVCWRNEEGRHGVGVTFMAALDWVGAIGEAGC